MSDTQAQLDAAIAAVVTITTQLGTDLNATITALLAKIAALQGQPPPPTIDFTPEVTQLQEIAATLTTLDQTATAANPPAAS
jgi:hypothetical protein